MIHVGSLVITPDGYYGIVTHIDLKYVFMANGCESQLSDEEWAALRELPLNINHKSQATASFIGLERSAMFDEVF